MALPELTLPKYPQVGTELEEGLLPVLLLVVVGVEAVGQVDKLIINQSCLGHPCIIQNYSFKSSTV